MSRCFVGAMILVAVLVPVPAFSADGPLPIPLPQRTKDLNQELRKIGKEPGPQVVPRRASQTDERFTNHAAGHAYNAHSHRIRGPGAIFAALAVGVAAFATNQPFWFCIYAALAVGITVTIIIWWRKSKQAPASELVPAPASTSEQSHQQQRITLTPNDDTPPKVYGWKHLVIGLGILVAIFLIGSLISSLST